MNDWLPVTDALAVADSESVPELDPVCDGVPDTVAELLSVRVPDWLPLVVCDPDVDGEGDCVLDEV